MPCDTFVALGSAVAGRRGVLFAKNSDRPEDEAQEIRWIPARQYASEDARLKCTYIEIPQVARTHACVLSAPVWMWGAEMGANEHGVVVGNEAVWTREPTGNQNDALLGMDLLRLALERSGTAAEALSVITELLEEYGQGGNCSNDESYFWTYHNSFIVADYREAFILETAGKQWVYKRVTDGVWNISNCLSLRSDFDGSSRGLLDYAKSRGLWDGIAPFDWLAAFSTAGAPEDDSRFCAGRDFLRKHQGALDIATMGQLLRQHAGGICMHGGFSSTGSQISFLPLRIESGEGAEGEGLSARHFFTGTSHPCVSLFKPVAFLASGEPDKSDRELWDLSKHLSANVDLHAWRQSVEALHSAPSGRDPSAEPHTLFDRERSKMKELCSA